MNKKAIEDKLDYLATQFSFASTVKESAKIRLQCSLDEWSEVKRRAKDIYFLRKMNVVQ